MNVQDSIKGCNICYIYNQVQPQNLIMRWAKIDRIRMEPALPVSNFFSCVYIYVF